MRKVYLSAMAVSVAMVASAADAPSVQWANLLGGYTKAGDQCTAVTINNEGDVYWFSTLGSSNDVDGDNNFRNLYYGGEFLYEGASYTGTSQNNNFTLLKTDEAGSKQWVVYSTNGDFANNAGGMACTSDGGVVVVSKVRHTDGYTDKNIVMVDAGGNEHDIDWTCEQRYYKILVTKISAVGDIEWNRDVVLSTAPAPGAPSTCKEFIADAFNIGNIVVDNADNIYLSLNYRTELSVNDSDGTEHTFIPTNITKWTGDPQAACGDFMVLGLDKDGYYRNSLTLDGELNVGYCQNIFYENGKLYSQGYLIGDGTESATVGGYTFTPTTVTSPVIICTDTDLNVEWAKCLRSEAIAGKSGFQNCGINVCGDNLWFVGMYNLKLTDPEDETKFVAATQGALREGFIIKFNSATGRWIASRDSRDDEFSQGGAFAKTGLTGYLSVVQSPDNANDVYVMGYVMNANVGVFIRKYDANTLVADLDNEYNIITGGGAPSFITAAYDLESCAAYVAARGNKAFDLLGNESTAPTNAWDVLTAKVNLPMALKTTGVENIAVDAVDDNAPVEYYNLQGVRIINPDNGIYIRRQGNTAAKVIL